MHYLHRTTSCTFVYWSMNFNQLFYLDFSLLSSFFHIKQILIFLNMYNNHKMLYLVLPTHSGLQYFPDYFGDRYALVTNDSRIVTDVNRWKFFQCYPYDVSRVRIWWVGQKPQTGLQQRLNSRLYSDHKQWSGSSIIFWRQLIFTRSFEEQYVGLPSSLCYFST